MVDLLGLAGRWWWQRVRLSGGFGGSVGVGVWWICEAGHQLGGIGAVAFLAQVIKAFPFLAELYVLLAKPDLFVVELAEFGAAFTAVAVHGSVLLLAAQRFGQGVVGLAGALFDVGGQVVDLDKALGFGAVFKGVPSGQRRHAVP